MKKTIFVQASCFVFVVQLVYTIYPTRLRAQIRLHWTI